MAHDIEDLLADELHRVADQVAVPPLPALPTDAPRPARWLPLLATAAVLLVVLGLGVYVLSLGEGDDVAPAPQPTPTGAVDPDRAGPLSTAAPTDHAYVLDGRLYVGTERAEGTWAYAHGTPEGWLGLRGDGTWWFGYDAEPQPLGPTPAELPQPPALSPDGRYHAEIVAEDGQGSLTGASTVSGGEGFGVPVPVPLTQDGVDTSVRAVTNSGQVIVQGPRTAVLWQPLVPDSEPVDLTRSAPDQQVLGVSDAGLLIVVDGSDGAIDGTMGEPYLAELGEDGTMTGKVRLPNFSAIAVGTDWAVSAEPGSLGGEGFTLDELTLTPLDGGEPATLSPPEGYAFVGPSPQSSWWAGSTELLVMVHADEKYRMARCDAERTECVLVDLP